MKSKPLKGRRKLGVFLVFVCKECGSKPAGSDEDGCCTGCGADKLRIMKVSPHSPSKERAVKAAKAFLAVADSGVTLAYDLTLSDLQRAMAAYEKERSK